MTIEGFHYTLHHPDDREGTWEMHWPFDEPTIKRIWDSYWEDKPGGGSLSNPGRSSSRISGSAYWDPNRPNSGPGFLIDGAGNEGEGDSVLTPRPWSYGVVRAGDLSLNPTQWMGITITRSENHAGSYDALIHLEWATGPLVDDLRPIRGMYGCEHLVIWKDLCRGATCMNAQCHLDYMKERIRKPAAMEATHA